MSTFQNYTSAASGSGFSAFSKALDGLGGKLLIYAGVLAAIGTIAMGIVEMAKSVSRALLFFNRWRVRKWTKSDSVLAELELLSLGAHTDPDALYDQPVEKMMGQVQAAANLVLEYMTQIYGGLVCSQSRYKFNIVN